MYWLTINTHTLLRSIIYSLKEKLIVDSWHIRWYLLLQSYNIIAPWGHTQAINISNCLSTVRWTPAIGKLAQYACTNYKLIIWLILTTDVTLPSLSVTKDIAVGNYIHFIISFSQIS